MRYAAIVLLLSTTLACQHLQAGLRIIQDPVVKQLISDLTALIALIEQTAAQTPATPEARQAMEAAVDQQVEAAAALIAKLRVERQSRAADQFDRDLAAALEPLRAPPIVPATP